MSTRDEQFLERLLATFKIEAREHLRAMSSGVLALESAPAGKAVPGLLEKVFREAHSLKGAARAVNLGAVEIVCQALEDVFADIKNERLTTFSELFDVLHETIDGLDGMLADGVAKTSADAQAADLQTRLKRIRDKRTARNESPPARPIKHPRHPRKATPPKTKRMVAPPPSPHAPAEIPELAGTTPRTDIRIAVSDLDTLLLKAEEMLLLKHALGQRVEELKAMQGALALEDRAASDSSQGRPNSRHQHREDVADGNDRETTSVGGDHTATDRRHPGRRKKSLTGRAFSLARSLEQDYRTLARMVDSLLADTKKMLMLPFGTAVEMLPKLARDLSRNKGRDVDIVIDGTEIVIDKRILEGLKDPLIHLVRNAIDHGIEDPAERRQRSKPERGRLAIALNHKGGRKIEILVSDDGAGIDATKVADTATKVGLVTQEEAGRMSDADVLSFVFRSGFSTAPIITDLSGRGLGLAIVREKVEELGGTIAVETERGVGTAFRIVLPLTLENARGLLITAGGHRYLIPMAGIAWAMRLSLDDLKTVENHDTIQRGGQTFPLVWLTDALGLPRDRAASRTEAGTIVVALAVGGSQVAFCVDKVHGEQEILVKSLGAPLRRVRNVSGAAILGTGQVIPILNTLDLLKSASRIEAAPQQNTGPGVLAPQSILVAEDSITARMLLKNILMAAGYEVATAVDGSEALSELKARRFDLLVSDVEMPEMDGFELTEKVRAYPPLAALPIILVTALGSREHRERGIAVGANAYIVKSSFDQGNLLEIVKRLI